MADNNKSSGLIKDEPKAVLYGKGEYILSKKEAEGLRSLAINIDVSEALKGLKALQRETKKATKSINEFANFLNNNEQVVPMLPSAFTNDDSIKALAESVLPQIPTMLLQNELIKRKATD